MGKQWKQCHLLRQMEMDIVLLSLNVQHYLGSTKL